MLFNAQYRLHYSSRDLTSPESTVRFTSRVLPMAILFILLSKMFAFFAIAQHHQLMFSLWADITPCPFLQGCSLNELAVSSPIWQKYKANFKKEELFNVLRIELKHL